MQNFVFRFSELNIYLLFDACYLVLLRSARPAVKDSRRLFTKNLALC